MKHTLIIIFCITLASANLTAQTRYFSASYNNSTILFLDDQGGAGSGSGVSVGTFKFKNNRIMRGFSFTYNKLGTANIVSGNDPYTGLYSEETINGSLERMSLGYESYRLWGRKELDDPGAFYGMMGYYAEYYSEETLEEAYKYYRSATVDFTFKLGIGYQHRIGMQFIAFGELKGSLSVSMNTGSEYNIGIRYRGLGKGH